MRILHLESDASDARLVRDLITLEWPDCRVTWVESRAAFARELQASHYDLILSADALASLSGIEALKLAQEQAPSTPFIFVSGTMGEDRAIEAMRAGAADCVHKDRMKRLTAVIDHARRESEERKKRLQAESRIRELADFLNQAREAVIVTDLEGRITFWNQGAERLTGWTPAEAVDKCFGDLCGPATSAQLATAGRIALQAGAWIGEVEFADRQQALRLVELRMSLILDDAGRPRARLALGTDVTERKKLEEQFLRAQRMENIGLLAAGIAHDLNNMLAPILLAAPMLRDHVADAGALELLKAVEESAQRGANLVRQILAFARGASGDQRVLPLKHLVREVASVIAGTFPKSIRLEEFIPNNLWPVKINPTQIHQVLLNLALNARDAMPDGGTLRLRVENRVLDSAVAAAIVGGLAGAYLVLRVEDTGTGISPEVLKQMWEPFFTTKEPGKGTGLGLSTVRGIVENHNGFIQVTTGIGVGTTFEVYLPAAEEPSTDRSSPVSCPLPFGKGELILVVDDERAIREMTLTMLTRNGYRVILAGDGTEAVAVFAQRAAEIRLVITDLHMPNLDGVMLGRVLRRINPATKMLVMSGMNQALGNRPDYRPEEFGDGFLAKPFKAGILLARVHELLRAADAERLTAK